MLITFFYFLDGGLLIFKIYHENEYKHDKQNFERLGRVTRSQKFQKLL